MDNFSYKYEETLNSGNNNRLSWVDDLAGVSLYADADIDNSMNSGNYEYDKLGQLLSDDDEGIGQIEWRYGDKKIKGIERSVSVTDDSNLEFIYNPFGQRVIKLEKPIVGGLGLDAEDWIYTYYTYDANGQVMGVYTATISGEEKNNQSSYIGRLNQLADILIANPTLSLTIIGNIAVSEDYNKNDPNKTWDFPSGTPGVTLGELSDYRTLVLYNFFVNKGVLPNQLKRQRGSISTNYNGTPLKVTYNK